MTEAYPLHWPVGRQRTKAPAQSRFDVGHEKAIHVLGWEVQRLGGRQLVISTDIELRRDGLPYANQKVTDTGVAVYFMRAGKQQCFACDRWNAIKDNVWAIAKTIEALRGIARWGTGDMLAAAFDGFAALPPPKDWRAILGDCKSVDEMENSFYLKAKVTHPDAGGSNQAMVELIAAREAAHDYFKGVRL